MKRYRRPRFDKFDKEMIKKNQDGGKSVIEKNPSSERFLSFQSEPAHVEMIFSDKEKWPATEVSGLRRTSGTGRRGL